MSEKTTQARIQVHLTRIQTRSINAGDSCNSKTWIQGPCNTMMPKPVPQGEDHAALVGNEFPGSTQGVATAITHGHGGFLQLAVIRRRDSVDCCLLGSRLGSSSKTSDFAVPRLNSHLQDCYYRFCCFKPGPRDERTLERFQSRY